MSSNREIEAIYKCLDDDKVEQAVLHCLRVSRKNKDHINTAIFLRELYPNDQEIIGLMYDDISSLTPKARKIVMNHSFERWAETHTLDFFDTDNTDKKNRMNLLTILAGEIETELAIWNDAISDYSVPNGLHPVDATALTEEYSRKKMDIRMRIKGIQTIKSRIKTRCMNYAIQIEQQLESQKRTQSFLEEVQNEVNNYFKSRCVDVYQKLHKASQLTSSKDGEDFSLLLTEVRRALKASADHFYPPVKGKVACSDGVSRCLGEDEYLNRLQEFLATTLGRSSSSELLNSELKYLAEFMRRLNSIASKGVHSSITLAEAKQGLVGVYLFLYNVCTKLSTTPEALDSAE